MPRKVVFGEYATLILSDTAVVFAGLYQCSSTNEGQTVDLPVRFTLVVTKGGASVTFVPLRGPAASPVDSQDLGTRAKAVTP